MLPVILAREGRAVLDLIPSFPQAGRAVGIDVCVGISRGHGIAIHVDKLLIQTQRKGIRPAFDGGGETMGIVAFRRRFVIKDEVRSVGQGQGFQQRLVAEQRREVHPDLGRERGEPGAVVFQRRDAARRHGVGRRQILCIHPGKIDVVVVGFFDAQGQFIQPRRLLRDGQISRRGRGFGGVGN